MKILTLLLGVLTAVYSKPNFVIIVGDDIGWNDFGFHGSNQIPTPNIDALGYNGVFLNHLYTQPTCTPSRAALLTGRYPMKMGLQGTPIKAGEDRPLPNDIETLPMKLKQLGYKTHLVGKWHLSSARRKDLPTARGFDSHFGYWNGYIGYFDHFISQNVNNATPPLSGLDLHDDIKPQWQYRNQYVTDMFTKKALEVIDKHNVKKPLFLMVAHLAAHTGANGTELGVPDLNYTRRTYSHITNPMRQRLADVVNRLDNSVGQIVKKLSNRGMLENTVILFFSDNGAQTIGLYQNHGSNYPFKGLKFTLLEGGVRGSAVLYSPMLYKKGYVNNNLMHLTDIYTTFICLAGGSVDYDVDGIDQWPTISYDFPTPRHEVLLNIDELEGYSAIISKGGRYKFLNGSYQAGIYDGAYGETGRNGTVPPYNIQGIIRSPVNEAIKSLSKQQPLTPSRIIQIRQQLDISHCNGKTRTRDSPCLRECLFDLWEDPCETENLNTTLPYVVKLLKQRLNSYINELVPERMYPVDLSSNPRFYNNTWCTWLDDGQCYKTM
ncbi:arylsulfatase B-like isoform X2 [Rhynchophorus ferrugineus]|uniref:Sulfatase N-terminal domain-containing protein n=1 Tax=Rhynchophorus ferrugineus TaxID=354439 RepID=A0A834IT75_RHYFE|nr:hypothetical protein GWI33_009378 [Rhynchophorus ferrugineus]